MDFDPRTESPGDPLEDDAWTIDSLAKLTWAMKILRGVAVEADEVKDVAAAEIDAITRWRDSRLSVLKAKAGRLEAMAATYARAQRMDKGTATQSTPYGSVRVTRTSEKIAVEDKAALLDYVTSTGRFGWCSLTPLPGKIKAEVEVVDGYVYDTDGTAVPGVRRIPADYSITFNYSTSPDPDPQQED